MKANFLKNFVLIKNIVLNLFNLSIERINIFALKDRGR